MIGTRVEINCATCKNPLLRLPYQVKANKRHFCSRKCWANAKDRHTASRDADTYFCPRCKSDCPKDKFVWNLTSKGVPKRRGYCVDCSKLARKVYHLTHKEQAKVLHDAWRGKSLQASGDSLLKWVFNRRLSIFRRHNRIQGLLECDLDSDFLVGLYHQQKGLCYYSGQEMLINTSRDWKVWPDTLSVDRLTPAAGYFKSNVVLCTCEVNTGKGNRTEEAFYSFCEGVIAYRAGRLR